MTSREEELKKLKERYAQTRGAATAKEPVKEPVKRIAAPKMGLRFPRMDLKPCLHVIENDFRKLMGLKSLEEIERENKYDPLLEVWKRSRNMK